MGARTAARWSCRQKPSCGGKLAPYSILVHWHSTCSVSYAAAALSTLGYGWYRAAITELESTHNKIESAAQKAKKERVKALLGRALAAGTGLIGEQNKKDEDQAKRDAETWATQTHDLIAAAYGDGEAVLFLDSSGYVFYGDGSEKSKIRN